MNRQEQLYTFLCIIFAVLAVSANLIYQKFVFLTVRGLGSFELSVGALLYPLAFLISDLIVEFFGKQRAKMCVRMAILMNIFMALFINIFDRLPAASWSRVGDETFHLVFGGFGVAFIGSVLASYISQLVDIAIFSFIKRLTGGRMLWLRNNLSTGISLLVDTSIVVSFLSVMGILPTSQAVTLIFNSFAFKLILTVACTPIFYLSVAAIKHFVSVEAQKSVLS